MRSQVLPPKLKEVFNNGIPRGRNKGFEIAKELVLYYLAYRALSDRGDIISFSTRNISYFYQRLFCLNESEREALRRFLTYNLKRILDELGVPYTEVNKTGKYIQYFFKREELLKSYRIMEQIHYLKALEYVEEVIAHV